MKKIDLVHTTILIVAILAGYSALQSIISLLSLLVLPGNEFGFEQASQQYIFIIVQAIAFAIACVMLVKNGRKYAEIILKTDPESLAEDAPRWDIDRRNILFVLFIGIGLYVLIQSIPALVNDLYKVFSDKIGGNLGGGAIKEVFVLDLLRATIGCILIYAAPNLTNFIEKTIAIRLDKPDSTIQTEQTEDVQQ